MAIEKNKIIAFRVTEAEYQVIEAAAEKLGLKVSDYARGLAIRDSIGWKSHQYDRKVPLSTFSGTAAFMQENAETKRVLYGDE